MLQQSQTNTTNPDQYNGWSNKETWLINLWINNDPYLQENLLDIISYDDGIYLKIQTLRELVENIAFDSITELYGTGATGLGAGKARVICMPPRISIWLCSDCSMRR